MSLTKSLSDAFNVTKPTDFNNKFLTKVPGPEKPLVFKLLGDPRSKQAYIPMSYYKHQIGPSEKDHTRSHPSSKTLGLTESAPENEAFWEIVKEISAAKKAGEDKTEEGKKNLDRLYALKKMFQAIETGWFYYYEPGSPTIKAAKFGKDVLNKLFGRAAKGEFIKEVPSLLKSLASEGASPYDVDSDTCWLSLHRTGQGLATEYHLQVLKNKEEFIKDGKKFVSESFTSLPVNNKIRSGDVKLEDFPDPIEHEMKNAFTVEESIAFVNSVKEGGLAAGVVPSRFLKTGTDNNLADEAAPDDSGVPLAKAAGLDDIPF